MVMALYAQEWGDAPIHNPDLVAAFEDHFVLIDRDTVPLRVRTSASRRRGSSPARWSRPAKRSGICLHGPRPPYPAGVCHPDRRRDRAPRTIIVLTDSHTPTAGVLGAFAFGVGSTAMAFALRTGSSR
ncbi:MAG: aconitase family protein [Nannocystaceae bacterium]